MSVKRYPEQDPIVLDKAGGYYMRHVHAMTVEALHGKSEIAEQLGWRDQRIDALEAEVAELRKTKVSAQAVIDAFEVLGKSYGIVSSRDAKQNCEATMIALKDALTQPEADHGI